MNRNLLPFLIIFFCVTSLKAQLGLSVKGGVNFANINQTSFYNQPNFNGVWGVAYGFGLEKDLLKNLNIQGEFLFSSHGFQFDESTSDFIFTGKTQYSYIQIPVLLKYHLSFNNLRINLFSGPHFCLGFGYVKQVNQIGPLITEEEALFMSSSLRGYDLGLTSGIGLDYLFEKGKLHIEGRYQGGMIDIARDENIQIRNRNFQFLIGYTFYLDSED
jgi:hypothetical protein